MSNETDEVVAALVAIYEQSTEKASKASDTVNQAAVRIEKAITRAEDSVLRIERAIDSKAERVAVAACERIERAAATGRREGRTPHRRGGRCRAILSALALVAHGVRHRPRRGQRLACLAERLHLRRKLRPRAPERGARREVQRRDGPRQRAPVERVAHDVRYVRGVRGHARREDPTNAEGRQGPARLAGEEVGGGR